jgi:carboxylate-amine ligase
MTNGYRFGLEAEYLLVEADTNRPLWLHDRTFADLNRLLESIAFEPLLEGRTLAGLELDPPHTKLMPFYVEGYALADAALTTNVDVLPKGIEIRTPVCPDLDSCLRIHDRLFAALEAALAGENLRALGLGHHPEAWEFRGPQNHRREDWWHWSERVTTTYGPDLNLSVPPELAGRFDWEDLQRRANYYGPALVAFGLNAPLAQGRLWTYRGRPGYSARTFRRSLYAPLLAYHPKEGGRVEFKAFDMPTDPADFRPFFLLWLWLMHDTFAPGRADAAERVYDLGQVARFGWEAEAVASRAEEALDRAAVVLPGLGVDPAPLGRLRRRLARRWVPARRWMAQWRRTPDLPGLLRRPEYQGAA